jgi:hypothetical protein
MLPPGKDFCGPSFYVPITSSSMMVKSEVQKAGQALGAKAAIKVLDSLLSDTNQKRISEDQIVLILDALAGAEDPALVARFPVLLAICARRGITIDNQALFSRYWASSPKKQNIEILLAISAELFEQVGLELPMHLDKIAASLKFKHAGLLSKPSIRLSGGPELPVFEISNIMRSYKDGLKSTGLTPEKKDHAESPKLHVLLNRLFSPKQKDLIFKKIKGEMFTKTEREYFSRTVRKKLEAIIDKEVSQIASKIIRK